MRALLIATLAVAATATPASAAAKSCGVKHEFVARGFTYSVKIKRGDISCAAASRVMKQFVKTGSPASGYTCARTHSDNPYKPAARCSDGTAFVNATLVAG